MQDGKTVIVLIAIAVCLGFSVIYFRYQEFTQALGLERSATYKISYDCQRWMYPGRSIKDYIASTAQSLRHKQAGLQFIGSSSDPDLTFAVDIPSNYAVSKFGGAFPIKEFGFFQVSANPGDSRIMIRRPVEPKGDVLAMLQLANRMDNLVAEFQQDKDEFSITAGQGAQNLVKCHMPIMHESICEKRNDGRLSIISYEAAKMTFPVIEDVANTFCEDLDQHAQLDTIVRGEAAQSCTENFAMTKPFDAKGFCTRFEVMVKSASQKK